MGATVLPYTPLEKLLRFIPLPAPLLTAIAFLAVTYLFVAQAVKSWSSVGTRYFDGTG
jgi:hypothetical protein